MELSPPFHQLLQDLVETRVEKTLARLVAEHRNGQLDGLKAQAGIAAIAALRSLPKDLAERIKEASK